VREGKKIQHQSPQDLASKATKAKSQGKMVAEGANLKTRLGKEVEKPSQGKRRMGGAEIFNICKLPYGRTTLGKGLLQKIHTTGTLTLKKKDCISSGKKGV